MNLINSMQTLKNEIKASRGKREQDLKDIRRDTKQVQQDTRRAIAGFEKTRQEEAENLTRDLTSFTKDLSQDVDTLRQGFQQDQAEVRKEILTASRIWHGKASAIEKPEAKEDEGEE